MSYLVWEPDLDTGINVIDAQHHRIVEMINRLHAAQGAQRHDIVSEVVEELVDYTLFHFAFEETMIEEAGYPLTPEHRRIHVFARWHRSTPDLWSGTSAFAGR